MFRHLLITLALVALPFSAHAADPLTPAQAHQFIADTPNVLIIDVRTPQEFNEKHHPKAVNVPVESLEDILAANPDLIPNDKPVLLYCRRGVRASRAYSTILAAHPKADIRYVNGAVQEFLK